MSAVKPSIPKGTRDFGPAEMVRRTYIFDTIKSVFRKYGFLPIETPTMENLSTLTGKYGDEGDQLIFKVLNSGDYLAGADAKKLETRNSKQLISEISEKALRYDLTVPFARYVVMNQHNITFPFKRYQVQPVWRADRPQKGRYREFYQCDADVVGSESLLNEAELVLIYDEALSKLGLTDFTIKINNRKILSGIAEIIGEADKIVDITVAIDKLDKIGLEGVNKELVEKGVSAAAVVKLQPIIEMKGPSSGKLDKMRKVLAGSEIGLIGIAEIEKILAYLQITPVKQAKVELDITLARGLNYYTGAIIEVKANGVSIGSIGGGGRYDNLTGIFGLPGVSGVGISFGADRIYDVMEELKVFPSFDGVTTKVLITNFDEESEKHALGIASELRAVGINTELYPTAAKMKKQLSYADAKQIPFVLLVGSDEIASGLYTLKNMKTGEQDKLNIAQLKNKLM